MGSQTKGQEFSKSAKNVRMRGTDLDKEKSGKMLTTEDFNFKK